MTAMQESTDKIGYMINQLLISRHLERLAGHGENAGDMVRAMEAAD